MLGWILPLIYIIGLDFTTDMYRYSNNLNLGCWVGLFNWYALRRGWLSTESDQTDLLMVGSTICWVTSSINTRSCRRNGSWKWNKTINTDPPLLSSVGESKYALWKRRIYLMIYSCHSIIVGWYRRQEFRTSKWEAVLKFFNISAKNKISFKKFDLWLKRAISAERDLIYCSTSFDIQSFILPCILWLFHTAMQWTVDTYPFCILSILSWNFSLSWEWTLSSILMGWRTRQMASRVYILSFILVI